MEQRKIWVGAGITAMILLLGLISYSITDKTHYCESRGIVMDCERFSVSGARCYPNLENNKGYRDCKEGWVKFEGVESFNLFANGEMYRCFGREPYSRCRSESGKSAYYGELK